MNPVYNCIWINCYIAKFITKTVLVTGKDWKPFECPSGRKLISCQKEWSKYTLRKNYSQDKGRGGVWRGRGGGGRRKRGGGGANLNNMIRVLPFWSGDTLSLFIYKPSLEEHMPTWQQNCMIAEWSGRVFSTVNFVMHLNFGTICVNQLKLSCW